MLERQKEGIAFAKANGNYKGRLKGSKNSKEVILARYPELVKEIKADAISMRKIGQYVAFPKKDRL